MLFDTHAHMDDRAFDEDRETLLAALPGQGISLLMNPGCSLASSRAAAALSDSYDCIGEPFNISVIEAEAAEIAREKAAMRKKAREKLAAEMAALKEK